MASPEIEFRRARLEDKEAVLGMNKDAFFGIDNLDHYYDRYISHPNYMAYVMLVKGIVVNHSMFLFLVQVRLRTEVVRTPSSIRMGFKLMTSRS